MSSCNGLSNLQNLPHLILTKSYQTRTMWRLKELIISQGHGAHKWQKWHEALVPRFWNSCFFITALSWWWLNKYLLMNKLNAEFKHSLIFRKEGLRSCPALAGLLRHLVLKGQLHHPSPEEAVGGRSQKLGRVPQISNHSGHLCQNHAVSCASNFISFMTLPRCRENICS